MCKLQSIANISCMIVPMHIIAKEYWGSTLFISVLDTNRSGTKFCGVSAVQEIIPQDYIDQLIHYQWNFLPQWESRIGTLESKGML